MNNEKDPLLSPEDELKAENTFLKMKLGLEHGMEMTEANALPPDVENQWLKSVYAFEQHYKDAKRVKLYDYLGKPEFKRWDTLTPEEIHKERKRLESIMEENNVQLDCICEYDDALIYKFITEELFDREMDDMRIPGMTLHYTYEEFYPNHDYDLRRDTSDFVNAVYTREWDEQFDDIKIARNVSYAGKQYDRAGVASIIKTFQEAHEPLEVGKFDINEVNIESDLTKADVRASLYVSGKMRTGEAVRYNGVCRLIFVRTDEYWHIGEFDIPAFGDKEKG